MQAVLPLGLVGVMIGRSISRLNKNQSSSRFSLISKYLRYGVPKPHGSLDLSDPW